MRVYCVPIFLDPERFSHWPHHSSAAVMGQCDNPPELELGVIGGRHLHSPSEDTLFQYRQSSHFTSILCHPRKRYGLVGRGHGKTSMFSAS